MSKQKVESAKELYQLFEARNGNEPRDVSVSPREYGKRLASELIKRIEEEVEVS
jgi:hypothetical protein